jgi:hypothetical protein
MSDIRMNGIIKHQRSLFVFNILGTLAILGGAVASVAGLL